jgi:hypothetical protein
MFVQKITVFWVVTLCSSQSSISEELIALLPPPAGSYLALFLGSRDGDSMFLQNTGVPLHYMAL